MRIARGGCAAAVAMLVLAGCATNDEMIAEKDRMVAERATENENLRKRLADAESTRLVVQKQLEQKADELERIAAENERLQEQMKEAPPAEAANAGGMPVDSPAAVVRIEDPEIEVEATANGNVVLRMSSSNMFASGSADLTAQGQKLLEKVAVAVKRYPEFGISVEGHTDDTPLKKTADRWKNNLNLSIARAMAVKMFLNVKGKVADERMRVVGYGEKRPLVPAKTDEARARNRRVEVVLYKQT